MWLQNSIIWTWHSPCAADNIRAERSDNYGRFLSHTPLTALACPSPISHGVGPFRRAALMQGFQRGKIICWKLRGMGCSLEKKASASLSVIILKCLSEVVSPEHFPEKTQILYWVEWGPEFWDTMVQFSLWNNSWNTMKLDTYHCPASKNLIISLGFYYIFAVEIGRKYSWWQMQCLKANCKHFLLHVSIRSPN